MEQATIRKSLLAAEHINAGALMADEAGWYVPASFGDHLAEYAAVRDAGLGVIDLSNRGRVCVTGSEAIQFLNGLITNDMKTLEPGQWMPAAFPNVQGRLIASVRVIRLADKKIDHKIPAPRFLIDTEPWTHQVVLQTLTRFTLAGDFQVSDWTDNTAMISLQGREALKFGRAFFGGDLAGGQQSVFEPEWSGTTLSLWRASHSAEDGLDVVVDSDHAVQLWDSLRTSGAQPVGSTALEILRIEAGLPRYGKDMDETNVVSETNLDDAISFTKGCYIGQEIIARIKYRGHVAKKLTGIMFTDRVEVASGVQLVSGEGKEIGRLTSVTFSPRLKRTVALGYVKYDYLAPGTEVRTIVDAEELTGTVADLPFIRGSWYDEQK